MESYLSRCTAGCLLAGLVGLLMGWTAPRPV
jgi:hypothetical protein